MAFRDVKMFFFILQVRISVAGASQKTRVRSHPPYMKRAVLFVGPTYITGERRCHFVCLQGECPCTDQTRVVQQPAHSPLTVPLPAHATDDREYDFILSFLFPLAPPVL